MHTTDIDLRLGLYNIVDCTISSHSERERFDVKFQPGIFIFLSSEKKFQKFFRFFSSENLLKKCFNIIEEEVNLVSFKVTFSLGFRNVLHRTKVN